MKKHVNVQDFIDEFQAIRPNNFSVEGLRVLFEHLESCEDDADVELDVIAMCCDFAEYDSMDEALRDYSVCKDEETIKRMTLVLDVPNGHVIIQQF